MNTAAMTMERGQLLGELDRRRERKVKEQAELDSRLGQGRIHITSYMENIGWPELFGYPMSRMHHEPEFAADQTLRELIFWADNVQDDTVPEVSMRADVGKFWEYTLFGMRMRHTSIGVPDFQAHPLQQGLDIAKLGTFDFHSTGDMPSTISKYRRLREISDGVFKGRLHVHLPCFERGPLDVFVQLRGYEGFVEDTAERPEALAEALLFLVDERLRFARARQSFLGEPGLPPTVFVGDDWVNVPFLSPRAFHEFVAPAFKRLRAGEGPVTGFHTCGGMEPVVNELLECFPEIEMLEVSGWNDVRHLDAAVDPRVGFAVAVINTITLGGSEAEQRAKLEAARDAARHRRLSVCAQAIQRLHSTYEETFERLNTFLSLGREVLSA